MKIEQWLNNVCYDDGSQYFFSRVSNGEIYMIGEVRGWGALQNAIPNEDDAAKFQDEIGRFIAQAINEKVERLKSEN